MAEPIFYDWAHREGAPVGAWVLEDYKTDAGQPVSQVRDLWLDTLFLPEIDKNGRLQPEKRAYLDGYTQRVLAGETAPSITVIEMEDGRLRVTDGHRRVMAARAAGKTTVRALVSPLLATAEGPKAATRELVKTGAAIFDKSDAFAGLPPGGLRERALRADAGMPGCRNTQRMLSVILRQIQHGLQNIEGIASGGSPSGFYDSEKSAPAVAHMQGLHEQHLAGECDRRRERNSG